MLGATVAWLERVRGSSAGRGSQGSKGLWMRRGGRAGRREMGGVDGGGWGRGPVERPSVRGRRRAIAPPPLKESFAAPNARAEAGIEGGMRHGC
jgi:hypothetical protein